MSRLWSRLFGRAPSPPEDAAETVEVQALAPEPLAPPEVAPEPKVAEQAPRPQAAEPAPPAPEPEPEPEPEIIDLEPQAAEPEPEPEPEPAAEAHPAGTPTAADVEARLGELLDSLGAAHRRPFVRNG